MLLQPLFTALLLPTLALAKSHQVSVGSQPDAFNPSVVHAQPGDEVVFKFFPGGDHGVASSVYKSPCKPGGSQPIWSGFQNNHKTFTVPVKDTAPIWIYCPQFDHCPADGMSMVINPGSGETISNYRKRAGKTTSSTPKKKQGGTLSGGI